MFLVQHDFLANFNNAVIYKDNELLSCVFYSEIAKLLIGSKKDTIAVIKKYKNIDRITKSEKVLD